MKSYLQIISPVTYSTSGNILMKNQFLFRCVDEGVDEACLTGDAGAMLCFVTYVFYDFCILFNLIILNFNLN
jgi:hypothetical protein